ncbi:MAG TPA: hypothetical protein VL093_05795 [Flavipsychrobacter sp.]|nr:hypothetical protein [Flavipsychrobacter sp.]
MKQEQRYIEDIAEIRSMMERSSKFLSLSGLAGIIVGIYALVGTYIIYQIFNFHPESILSGEMQSESSSSQSSKVYLLGLGMLVLAVGTAVYLSAKKAAQKGEKAWNASSRRLLVQMAVPLLAGGILILILLAKGMIGSIAPLTLIFYGIALFNAGNFTYREVKSLGIIEIILGLAAAYFMQYGLVFWAIGFGAFHIVYGIYMHFRYER